MLILHGFMMKSSEMEYIARKINRILPSNTIFKYNFLQAPKRPITIYGGKKYHAWYDYLSNEVYTEEKINTNHLKESREQIHKILDEEISLLEGNSQRVFILGYSQGCCTTLDSALTYPKLLGGVIGFKGHIPSFTEETKNYKQKIWVTHGENDDAIGYDVAKDSYMKYKKKGFDVKFLSQKNPKHDLNDGINEQMRSLEKWLTPKLNL